MTLTPEQRERLRKWSAEKMGWKKHSRPYRSYARLEDWYCDGESPEEHWDLYKMPVTDWRPLTDLNQAFQVLERVMSEHPDLGIVISHMYQDAHTWQPPGPVQWIVEAERAGVDVRIDDMPLAEALLVACARATGDERADLVISE